jgi:predicted nucleotidyltransferase
MPRTAGPHGRASHPVADRRVGGCHRCGWPDRPGGFPEGKHPNVCAPDHLLRWSLSVTERDRANGFAWVRRDALGGVARCPAHSESDRTTPFRTAVVARAGFNYVRGKRLALRRVSGCRQHTLRPLSDLVDDYRDDIKAIVCSHHGLAVAVFGSIARGDDQLGSDLDFLVELDPDARPIEILSIGVALEDALEVPVDVGTPEALRANIRAAVLTEAIWL